MMVNLGLRVALMSLLLAGAACAAETNASAPGAKGMYYRQLEHPEQSLNNGIQYWIELKRRGEAARRVNNKFDFRSGDEIRLHVRPNMNSFAYVLLTEGSRGEHVELFPDPQHRDNNQLKANIEYTVPDDGSYLAFDQNAGTERLMVVLSRKPIAGTTVAPEKIPEKEKVIIAARVEGSKDLIPGSFVVGYNEAAAPSIAQRPPSGGPSAIPAVAPASQPDDGGNVITVVQKDPSNVLAVEIRLQHGE